eukprot:3246077-Amphidinium_carterae.1
MTSLLLLALHHHPRGAFRKIKPCPSHTQASAHENVTHFWRAHTHTQVRLPHHWLHQEGAAAALKATITGFRMGHCCQVHTARGA